MNPKKKAGSINKSFLTNTKRKQNLTQQNIKSGKKEKLKMSLTPNKVNNARNSKKFPYSENGEPIFSSDKLSRSILLQGQKSNLTNLTESSKSKKAMTMIKRSPNKKGKPFCVLHKKNSGSLSQTKKGLASKRTKKIF